MAEATLHFPMTEGAPPRLVLASASRTRSQLLRAVGLDITVDPADIDEAAIIETLRAGPAPMPPDDVAMILAETKAVAVSQRHPGALVIGADQTLAFDDRLIQKSADMAEARERLLSLSGRAHQLHAAVAVALDGEAVFRAEDRATLVMRPLSPRFVGRYLAAAGDAALSSVGAYQVEGLGLHLFDRIDGDHFTILGLPLLPLLAYLRAAGVVER